MKGTLSSATGELGETGTQASAAATELAASARRCGRCGRSTQQASTTELNHSLKEIAQPVARSAAAHESSDACADLSRLYSEVHRQLSQFELPSSARGCEQQFKGEPSTGWSPSAATGD